MDRLYSLDRLDRLDRFDRLDRLDRLDKSDGLDKVGSSKVNEVSSDEINFRDFLRMKGRKHCFSFSDTNWQVGQMGERDRIIWLFLDRNWLRTGCDLIWKFPDLFSVPFPVPFLVLVSWSFPVLCPIPVPVPVLTDQTERSVVLIQNT